jgi:hypothetical protein|tara:strand:+ start:1730 stop:2422 length:693 start_codon:yes stop_codon:yes gene_type:complete
MAKNEVVQEQMSQDTKQKINVAISFGLEFYRVLMGCLLIVFVPQKCGDKICGLGENVFDGHVLTDVAFYFNLVSCLVFCVFYNYEIKRENMLINYLEVNDDLPNDNDEVGKMLLKLPREKKDAILHMDGVYQLSGYLCMVMFLLNTVISGVPIFIHYLDNKTITVYITNVMFLAFKINDAYSVVNTDKNIFYSAYLSTKLQFNDVDPDKTFIDDASLSTKSDEISLSTKL